MSLKQSIVVVNQYTVRQGPGGHGSRGSSPGSYVMEYMARVGATEDLTPVRLKDVDEYITRYMARRDATEAGISVGDIKDRMRSIQEYGGVAFGNGDVSLSDESLKRLSKDIQHEFDEGKTVLKTVISFTPDYLKEMGCVSPDFECEKPGEYRGHLDQMKLRMALMEGVEKMSMEFDDLSYVGVIQVDTMHVHVHLAMVDKGQGHVMSDGTQRGRITNTMKDKLRRGIDMSLDDSKQVQRMASNVEMDRRNAVCFIKKFTHGMMERNGVPQFLMACLPENPNVWRARSNRQDMKKADCIVREYVQQVLDQPDSGYREALQAVDRYARNRQEREGLTDEQYRKLYKTGADGIVDDCVNAVYSTLRTIPEAERKVRTPMLDAMSMDYEAMAAETESDPMVEFGFRLRSYSSRLDFHKKETHKYHDTVAQYEKQEISESARPVMEFLRFEERYNTMLMAKYQHFLAFLPPDDEFEEDFHKLTKHRRRISNMEKLRADESARKMRPDRAEAYGREVYETTGGRFIRTNPEILAQRQLAMEQELEDMKSEFRLSLADRGLSLEENPEDGRLAVSRKSPYGFDDVKALDLHHLNYDFLHDIPVSRLNVERFVEAANHRHELYTKAAAYLKASGQGEIVSQFAGRDIELMKELADRVAETGQLPTKVGESGAGGRRSRTVALDRDYMEDMDMAVRMAVETARQLGESD